MNNDFSRWHKLAGLLTEAQNWQNSLSEGDTDYDRNEIEEDIDLGHNEVSSITPEGRFWIVTYRTIDGKKEKVFQSEDEARKFASTLNEDEARKFANFGPKKKMTKSEAKQTIKDAILAEMGSTDLEEASPESMDRMGGLADTSQVRDLVSAAQGIIRDLKSDGFDDEDIYDYLVDLIKTLPDHESAPRVGRDMPGFEGTMDALDSLSIREAKEEEEEEEEDVEVVADETGDDAEMGVDMTADSEVDADMAGDVDLDAGSSEAKKAFNELTDAYRAAKELGDEKLVRQLANTITYFNKNIILQND